MSAAAAGSLVAQFGNENAEALRAQLAELNARYTAALEKHQVDTEELQAMNEELRVASEELEAGKEELHTLNEELIASNQALKGKIDELGHANSDLQNLMVATAIATLFLDRELRVIRFTPSATSLFHLASNDAGQPLAHLRHDLAYPELEADAADVLTRLVPVEREIGGRDGRWFLARLLPYRTVDDRIAGLVLTCVNITERKQFEAHRQAREAAERVNQARSAFLSRMSHELRTPLNAILGFGQILEMGSRDEQDTMALGLILKAGRHLLSLVDEVLDLTRAESGELRLTFGTVDLEQLARECVQLTARLAQARGITCEVHGSAHPPFQIRTDEQRLRQILLNLLSNAIKYNRPNGRVRLSCERQPGGRCLISVHDTGQGIATDDIFRLFTPFERLHHQDGEIEGTGLGLAIARQLAEALGGGIGVESEVGRGSRFWIELPEGQSQDAAAVTAAAPSPVDAEIAATRGITLLCVEDNLSNLQLVQTVVARHWPHWRFLSARDGNDGVRLARRYSPDLILLDLHLPDHPGTWVLSELRRDARTAHLPVVVLSADATPHSRAQLAADGVADYLTKPLEIGELVRTVQKNLDFS